MKRFLLTAIIVEVLMCYHVSAQQEPQLTHYMFDRLDYNPAYAGSREDICATLLYHDQWSAFKGPDGEGGPITQNFNIHSAIGDVNTDHFGIGLNVLNDQEGFQKTTSFMIDGAYHKKIDWQGLDVSAGISVGAIQSGLNPTWHPPTSTPDPDLPGKVSVMGFDADAGLYVSNPTWYAGISAVHIPQPNLNWGEANSTVQRVYYIMAGYTIANVIPNKLDITPGLLIQTNGGVTQYNINAIAIYLERFYGGLNYHSGDALSVMAGLYLLKPLLISFSYDITTSQAAPFGGKTELLLTYCFKLDFGTGQPNFHKSTRFL